MHVVVDQPRQTPQRSALGRRLEIAFARDAILVVRHVIAERGHQLGEHYACVRLETILPLGVALGREVEQRLPVALEIAREVIDWIVGERVRRALRRPLLAIELRRTARLEGEADVVVERIDPAVLDVQAIERKIARRRGRDPEDVAAVDDEPPRAGDCDGGDRFAARQTLDAHALGRQIVDERGHDRGGILQEEHVEPRLRRVDRHEVDAGDGGLQRIVEQRDAIGERHQSVTSRFR